MKPMTLFSGHKHGKMRTTRLALIFRYTFAKKSNNEEKGGKGQV